MYVCIYTYVICMYIYIYIYIYVIYMITCILEHKQNAHNNGIRAQPLERLLETLFLAIKKCTGLRCYIGKHKGVQCH